LCYQCCWKALSENDLDARVTGVLPWVLLRYPELDWSWLVSHVKLRNLQNRLGFLVSVAREVAEARPDWSASAARLREVELDLDRARLAAETTLNREAMPQAEGSGCAPTVLPWPNAGTS